MVLGNIGRDLDHLGHYAPQLDRKIGCFQPNRLAPFVEALEYPGTGTPLLQIRPKLLIVAALGIELVAKDTVMLADNLGRTEAHHVEKEIIGGQHSAIRRKGDGRHAAVHCVKKSLLFQKLILALLQLGFQFAIEHRNVSSRLAPTMAKPRSGSIR